VNQRRGKTSLFKNMRAQVNTNEETVAWAAGLGIVLSTLKPTAKAGKTSISVIHNVTGSLVKEKA
jgi:hypothetical protein